MSDLNITIVLPSGGARTAEVPDDVTLHELMPELTSLLELLISDGALAPDFDDEVIAASCVTRQEVQH